MQRTFIATRINCMNFYIRTWRTYLKIPFTHSSGRIDDGGSLHKDAKQLLFIHWGKWIGLCMYHSLPHWPLNRSIVCSVPPPPFRRMPELSRGSFSPALQSHNFRSRKRPNNELVNVLVFFWHLTKFVMQRLYSSASHTNATRCESTSFPRLRPHNNFSASQTSRDRRPSLTCQGCRFERHPLDPLLRGADRLFTLFS